MLGIDLDLGTSFPDVFGSLLSVVYSFERSRISRSGGRKGRVEGLGSMFDVDAAVESFRWFERFSVLVKKWPAGSDTSDRGLGDLEAST